MMDLLEMKKNQKNVVIDATLWLWWHAIWVIDKMNDWDVFIWIDADEDNLKTAKERIENQSKNKNIQTYFVHSNFSRIRDIISEMNIDWITHIYYDFWVNSVHLDNWDKWFSFRFDWPLDLRYDRTSWITASDIVNTYDKKELRRVLFDYWEEKKTPFIVDEILKIREQKRINTTLELLEIIERSSFDPKSKIRVFQALRIEVNKEFQVIEKSLSEWIEILDEWWVMACITFHSLEDRLVKQIFNNLCEEKIDDLTWQTIERWKAEKINKKPIIPTQNEIDTNPRCRSAKLRAIKKL